MGKGKGRKKIQLVFVHGENTSTGDNVFDEYLLM